MDAFLARDSWSQVTPLPPRARRTAARHLLHPSSPPSTRYTNSPFYFLHAARTRPNDTRDDPSLQLIVGEDQHSPPRYVCPLQTQHPRTMMRTASIAALALVAPVVVAQKATRPDGACPGGYSPNSSGECVADACDVNHIKTPRHGTMGNCATREFEFLHTRPDPIDDTEVTIASLEGTLATIGIPFADWGSDQTFRFTDGAVFWSTPEDGPTGSATVAQVSSQAIYS